MTLPLYTWHNLKLAEILSSLEETGIDVVPRNIDHTETRMEKIRKTTSLPFVVDDIFRLGYFDGFEEHHFTGVRKDALSQLTEYLKAEAESKKQWQEVVTARWDARAQSWADTINSPESYVNHENGYDRFLKEIDRVLPLVSGSVIEVGCGNGEVSRHIISNNGGLSVDAIDISERMVQEARTLSKDFANLNFSVGQIHDLESPAQLVVSRGVVVSHVHRAEAFPFLEKLASLVDVGGYAIFDFISNLENGDDTGRLEKNVFTLDLIVAVMRELGLVHIAANTLPFGRVSIATFHRPLSNSVYFATSSAQKVIELSAAAKSRAIHLCNIDIPEIKSDDIVEIAKDKAKKSFDHISHPVIVTDGGIFIDALRGFPGPNSKQAALCLGPEGILKLLEGEERRTAVRRNCLVYFDGTDYRVCVSEMPLTIATELRDSSFAAYPLDRILIPIHANNPDGKTYKEMPVEDRVRFTELPRFIEFIEQL